jgi:hypothetical protein
MRVVHLLTEVHEAIVDADWQQQKMKLLEYDLLL